MRESPIDELLEVLDGRFAPKHGLLHKHHPVSPATVDVARRVPMSFFRNRRKLYNNTTAVLCPLCGTRRARRGCPALSQQICAICCGTKRLVQIQCPSDCTWLA